MLFDKSAEDYLEMIEATKSTGTYDFQVRKIASLKKYFTGVELETINKKTVVKYINFYRKQNPDISNVTLNCFWQLKNTIFGTLKYNGWKRPAHDAIS